MTIIDLSQPILPGMPAYPGDPRPEFEAYADLAGDGFRLLRLTLTSHTGTHIDAPAHCLADGKTIDQFPVGHFQGRAVVLDCRGVEGGKIGLSDLRLHGRRLAGADFVLLLTGWGERWGSEAYFNGFPVLSAEAVHWLTALPIRGLGLDAPSVDPPQATSLTNHHLLLTRDILILENLANLHRLPAGLCRLTCLPLLLVGAEAAPARIIAEWDEGSGQP